MTKRINWAEFDRLWNSNVPIKIICQTFSVSRSWVTRSTHLRGLKSRKLNRHFALTVNVSLRASDAEKLTRLAKETGLSKSGLLRRLIERAIP